HDAGRSNEGLLRQGGSGNRERRTGPRRVRRRRREVPLGQGQEIMARLRNPTRHNSNPEEEGDTLPLLNTPQPPPEEPRVRLSKPWDFDGFLEGVDQVGSRLREAGIPTSDDEEGDLLPLSTPQPPPAPVVAPENAPAAQVEAE